MVDVDLRVAKYDIIDYMNNCTNIILTSMPQGIDRDRVLEEFKRVKALVNNL